MIALLTTVAPTWLDRVITAIAGTGYIGQSFKMKPEFQISESSKTDIYRRPLWGQKIEQNCLWCPAHTQRSNVLHEPVSISCPELVFQYELRDLSDEYIEALPRLGRRAEEKCPRETTRGWLNSKTAAAIIAPMLPCRLTN